MRVRKIKKAFFIATLVGLAYSSHAQNAYFYIEGDQLTPIYVKVEGKMVNRLGKNYAIIPNLAAGYTHFEILFEQNKIPPQKFILEVPESGARGFVLNKVNDQQYALYDLEQKKFILAGNNIGDDYVLPSIAERHQEEQNFYQLGKEVSAREVILQYGQTNRETISTAKNKEALFIEDVILNDESRNQKTINHVRTPKQRIRYTSEELEKSELAHLNENFEPHVPLKVKTTSSKHEIENELPPIPNTDCPSSMSNQEFEQVALKFLNLDDDTQKLRFLRRRSNKDCYSTEQVRILANNMESQSGKFEVVKMLYIQTSDQNQYPELEHLFESLYIKSAFKELLNR